MKIHDTVTEFIKDYKPTTLYLNEYFASNQIHFDEYFKYHCLNKNEKLQEAINKHLAKLDDMAEICGKMSELIREIASTYENLYSVQFTEDVHLLVGLFGSNAYTYRQYIPEVAFCLEKLSPQIDHLRTIIAHEFGHVTHNLISIQEGIEWSSVDWMSPYTWLLQEGIATYFSTRVVSVRNDVYFIFEDDIDWLQFCEENKHLILKHFTQDLKKNPNNEIFKEWFSIRGGETFGKARLAYYIGYCFVTSLIEKFGVTYAITLWKERDFKQIVLDELETMIINSKG
ncbi:hypothetical protein CSE16_03170 [Solibacillus sp. R5-41]|uniref:hypothetical protein n=1 Tax=Solibacillus sp. R5-41 TaxID=2048654 RepID=UPI000C1246FB|nr:hypothetical protein [Solibacillus sp. R5-41]ATP39104.1 hypothetical protein CSE16_03170 [Solibacillus sp. R5-41]